MRDHFARAQQPGLPACLQPQLKRLGKRSARAPMKSSESARAAPRCASPRSSPLPERGCPLEEPAGNPAARAGRCRCGAAGGVGAVVLRRDYAAHESRELFRQSAGAPHLNEIQIEWRQLLERHAFLACAGRGHGACAADGPGEGELRAGAE
jgi:hypothetical protein